MGHTMDEPPQIDLSNAYASVRVRKVHTGNGVRLEIHAPKLGHTIRLDPLELESLTWQDKGLFSTLLSEPYGPDAKEDYFQAVLDRETE